MHRSAASAISPISPGGGEVFSTVIVRRIPVEAFFQAVDKDRLVSSVSSLFPIGQSLEMIKRKQQ